MLDWVLHAELAAGLAAGLAAARLAECWAACSTLGWVLGLPHSWPVCSAEYCVLGSMLDDGLNATQF